MCCNDLNEVLDCALLLCIIKHHSDHEFATKIHLMVDHYWFDKLSYVQGEVDCFDDEYVRMRTRIAFVLVNCFGNFQSTECFALRLLHDYLKSINEDMELHRVEFSCSKRWIF